MNDNPRGERLQIMLTQEELEALDTWRFARRMPSRAAAVRELLKRGLADVSSGAEQRTRSQDFGVIGASDGHAEPDGHGARPHGGNGGDRTEAPDGHGQ